MMTFKQFLESEDGGQLEGRALTFLNKMVKTYSLSRGTNGPAPTLLSITKPVVALTLRLRKDLDADQAQFTRQMMEKHAADQLCKAFPELVNRTEQQWMANGLSLYIRGDLLKPVKQSVYVYPSR